MTSFRPAGSERLAELRDVGAGKEGAAAAGEHDGRHLCIRFGRFQGVDEGGAHLVLQGVDRRALDGDEGNAAIAAELDQRVHPFLPVAPLRRGPKIDADARKWCI